MAAATETTIHPSAVVDPGAELGTGVSIGPRAVVGAGVAVGDGTEVGAGAVIYGPTTLGRDNRVFPQAAVGFEPQDLKYQGEETRLEVGDRNHFREFTTTHRGTSVGGGVTRIGSDNLFMAYSHVAHDCSVGDRCVFVNAATLAGHVTVEDDAVIGAFSAVHQFCRVGAHAYIGGYSVITMDALPYVKTVGQKPVALGVNSVGLRRKGFDRDAIRRLQSAVRLLQQSGLNTGQAIERLRSDLGGHPEIDHLIAFIESSRRGVIKALPGRRGERGGAAEVLSEDASADDDGASA
jgi:UDP-N-acetylglucosamine acyltransferase